MFDIGWSEMLMLAVLAVIVVGPKDLPQVLRVVGKWVGKARGMAREFQSGLEDIARETEIDQIKNEVNKAAAEFEKAATETESGIRDDVDVHSALDPSGTSDNAFSIEDPAAKNSGQTDQSDTSETVSEASEATGEWADRYASPTAPAHSVASAAPAETAEPDLDAGDTADIPPKTRTGT